MSIHHTCMLIDLSGRGSSAAAAADAAVSLLLGSAVAAPRDTALLVLVGCHDTANRLYAAPEEGEEGGGTDGIAAPARYANIVALSGATGGASGSAAGFGRPTAATARELARHGAELAASPSAGGDFLDGIILGAVHLADLKKKNARLLVLTPAMGSSAVMDVGGGGEDGGGGDGDGADDINALVGGHGGLANGGVGLLTIYVYNRRYHHHHHPPPSPPTPRPTHSDRRPRRQTRRVQGGR